MGVLLDGPLHGYEVRRKLELWGADSWANVAYGSIYHGLSKMADEGLLEIIESGKGGKTVYGITQAGRDHFYFLLGEYWCDVKPIVDPFQVAVTFMDRMSEGRLLALMHERTQQLTATVGMMARARGGKQGFGAPRHVDESLDMIRSMLQVQLDWLEQAIPRVKDNDLP
ncbi:PadR family transcriptional regulator [Sinosporangium siamense]|uniref:PadR family transcriptional regulator n=1 Tax=Sinosporangium siamense TaxID=1367973 RepID=A0A919RCG4_9ACTN|nr:PadR family transcriptional regulator [Sinosporangium siamense]GII91375.1 PadR family transcriptional regulator [Sinosporangium siamense]